MSTGFREDALPQPRCADRLEQALFEVRKVIVGQERLVERTMTCLLARGHCLIEGVPGVAKTSTILTVARTVGCDFRRIQFTPDLVPADIVGTRVYRSSRGGFDVEPGPVFANIVLADEINRAPAKVQSALLEIMAERKVTIGGATLDAPDPFLVLATQNPVESEGVHRLPEAQLDRFLMKVVVDVPGHIDEVEIVRRVGVRPPPIERVLTREELRSLQAATTSVVAPPPIIETIVRIVFATRDPVGSGISELGHVVAHGAGPRGSISLLAASRALALLRGRGHVTLDDVVDVVPEVLRHRIRLTYDAFVDGVTVDEVLARVLGAVVSRSAR